MWETSKNVIKFQSTNGKNTLVGYVYSSAKASPKAILMLCHGMCEYIARYDEFASFMVQNGYIVCGYDHLGHGNTSDEQGGIDGFFGEIDGVNTTINDMKIFCDNIKEKYKNLPFILLGHSMGSFFARVFAVKYKNDIDALIISGTAGPNPLGDVGIALAKIIKAAKGDKYRSKLIHDMAFKPYVKRISNPKTQYDWLTRDEEIVLNYSNDKKCTYVFTINGFLTLFYILKMANDKNLIAKTEKNMPILVISGQEDAVGNYGEGPKFVYDELKKSGGVDVQIKLFENARHEMLNELNKEEAYNFILNWCNSHLQNIKEN